MQDTTEYAVLLSGFITAPFQSQSVKSEGSKTYADCVGRVQTRQHEQSKLVKCIVEKLTYGKAQRKEGGKLSTSS